MKQQMILITVFALFFLSVFGQGDSTKRTLPEKGKQEKMNNGDSSKVNCLHCFYKRTNWGYQRGVGKYNTDRFSINYMSIYQITSYLSLGYGASVDFYLEEDAILLPLLTEIGIKIPEKNNIPYLAIRFGAPFELNDSEYFKDTGYLLNFSLGHSFDIPAALINMEVGYVSQGADIYNNSGLRRDVWLHAIRLSVGISMNK